MAGREDQYGGDQRGADVREQASGLHFHEELDVLQAHDEYEQQDDHTDTDRHLKGQVEVEQFADVCGDGHHHGGRYRDPCRHDQP